ncbi:hypothetical protein [Sphingomonas sp. ACRSK]|uniref:hypothetical protein n=1 Tax=Sphingomonas sp. ACRSK TaxID=2918213 RepID=UPI001EF61879|nr:hypothetical protein [Sphingomonas sp. ACRSK]MCG7348877.1 hypothetical protein [Sphingomonas sp. ACRSK]
MSRRNRQSRSNSPAASAGKSEMTVVDGNAVGVAPSGSVDTTSDDAVDAALAAIDAEISEKADVVALAEVEEVEIEQSDPLVATDVDTDADEIEAILAEAADAEVAGSDMPDDATAMLAEEAPLADADTPPAETVEDVVENLEAVSEDDVKEVIEKDADALLAALDADDNTDPQAVASAASATTKTPRKKKDAAPAAPATPKRDFHSVASIDPATFKTNLDGCNAKKVQEKAQNLIQAIETGKRLSRYTSVAVRRLVDDGKVTGKSLVEALQGEGLSLGTARAQAQQMTALFRIAGIAQPDATAPKELVIADKALAAELVKLAA